MTEILPVDDLTQEDNRCASCGVVVDLSGPHSWMGGDLFCQACRIQQHLTEALLANQRLQERLQVAQAQMADYQRQLSQHVIDRGEIRRLALELMRDHIDPVDLRMIASQIENYARERSTPEPLPTLEVETT